MGVVKLNVAKNRSINYFRQLKVSTLYKIGTICATFLAMPIMVKYLGVEQFGVWATMLTLITWVTLFDLGIGNGLKNKISESLAEGDIHQAVGYVSTAYVLIGIVSFLLFTMFLIANIWLPWQKIFNTEVISEVELKNSVITLSFFVFFNFWLSLVNQIYHGLQKSSVVALGQFISNACALIFIFLLSKFWISSVLMMVISYGLALVLANLLLSALIFKKNKDLLPSPKLFDKQKISPLLSLGVKFFVIQLAVLVIFMTDKIVITQLLGPEHVTPYEVLFKLFSIITVLHSLILVPLWPAYSDAYQRGDLEWIRAIVKQQIKVAIVLLLAAFLLALVGPFIVEWWMSNLVVVPNTLYFLFAILIVLQLWNNVFGVVLGAIGKVRLGAFHTAFSAILNIPLSIIFVMYFDLGLNGVLLSTVISISLSAFISPFQYWYFIHSSKKDPLLEKLLS